MEFSKFQLVDAGSWPPPSDAIDMHETALEYATMTIAVLLEVIAVQRLGRNNYFQLGMTGSVR